MTDSEVIKSRLDQLFSMVTQIQSAGQSPISYSEQEAALMLDMSELTLKRERRQRRIAYSPVGRHARYTRQHLEDYLRRKTIEAE